jgi:glycerate-2-kinase
MLWWSIMPDRKNIAREIFRQTVSSIDIPGTMERKLFLEGKLLILPDASVDLSEISEVRVVAIGKAAHSMVAGLPCVLPDGLPVCGVVSAPTKPEVARPGLQYFVGGHPLPR